MARHDVVKWCNYYAASQLTRMVIKSMVLVSPLRSELLKSLLQRPMAITCFQNIITCIVARTSHHQIHNLKVQCKSFSIILLMENKKNCSSIFESTIIGNGKFEKSLQKPLTVFD